MDGILLNARGFVSMYIFIHSRLDRHSFFSSDHLAHA